MMAECGSVPDGEVEWYVGWIVVGVPNEVPTFVGPVTAQTAFSAWRKVPGAPAFGSCRVKRVGGET